MSSEVGRRTSAEADYKTAAPMEMPMDVVVVPGEIVIAQRLAAFQKYAIPLGVVKGIATVVVIGTTAALLSLYFGGNTQVCTFFNTTLPLKLHAAGIQLGTVFRPVGEWIIKNKSTIGGTGIGFVTGLVFVGGIATLVTVKNRYDKKREAKGEEELGIEIHRSVTHESQKPGGGEAVLLMSGENDDTPTHESKKSKERTNKDLDPLSPENVNGKRQRASSY